MDEGAAERKNPIISSLFPVGEQSVLTAFGVLSPASEEEEEEEEEKRILRETNPYVLASFERLLESYTEKNAKQMLWGALIFYRALREEAKSKHVPLPTFTEQFVEDYDKQAQTNADKSAEEALRDKKLNLGKAAGVFRRNNIVIFRNLEPEFSRIVEEKLRSSQSNWLPEEDFKYTGILDMYFLFKKRTRRPQKLFRRKGNS